MLALEFPRHIGQGSNMAAGGSNCGCDLHRSPEGQDVRASYFLTLLVAGCPSGSGFLLNGQKVDRRRNYSVASARHTSVDDATEGKLEHDITRSEA
jgi:hypothetical protein